MITRVLKTSTNERKAGHARAQGGGATEVKVGDVGRSSRSLPRAASPFEPPEKTQSCRPILDSRAPEL